MYLVIYFFQAMMFTIEYTMRAIQSGEHLLAGEVMNWFGQYFDEQQRFADWLFDNSYHVNGWVRVCTFSGYS